jgi:uncharacterized membrane protein
MNNNLNLKIGDRVIRNYGNSLTTSIGIVTNITEKRGDYVVDYGNYKETYRCDGWRRSGDIWSRSHIQLLTPEIEEQIRQINLVSKCRDAFEKKKDLTADQAEKILAILNSEEKKLDS